MLKWEISERGDLFGMFPFITHILSLWEVSVENAEIITWNER